MGTNSLGLNQTFPIYRDVDGVQVSFHNLVLHKSVVDSVVMSLGDKITGDVYYINNHLDVSMQEYVVYNDVKYTLVNPPTIVKEGLVADNSELHGMTKYSFEFYHPMYVLSSMPFSDVTISNDDTRYLSESRKFSWMGNLVDYVAKLNKNLENTEWIVAISDDEGVQSKKTVLSDVLSFDNNFISDALKTAYDTWEVPFTIDSTSDYGNEKKFVILFGLPSNEIYTTDENDDPTQTPFVFQYGKGVGLKNNSRTPKNNKIVTRIVGYGSENNIPYGYPQIIWTGNQSWNYTINNTPGVNTIEIDGEMVNAMSYPIYDGIVGGRNVKLIKHPFTRNHLMPSVYRDTLNKKVNPYAEGFNPNIELVDYYDANNLYPNPINPLAPSCEIHEFEKVKPELGVAKIISVSPYDEITEKYITFSAFEDFIYGIIDGDDSTQREHDVLSNLMEEIYHGAESYSDSFNGGFYTYDLELTSDANFYYIKYTSTLANFDLVVLKDDQIAPPIVWDDTMDDDGNYKQSYFKITLPRFDFDIYACASITEEMSIAMRSGACIGCEFKIQVDWEDYKKNFYNENGDFDPLPHVVDGDGHVRDMTKYPNSEDGYITVVVQKDNNTFGVLMPNSYQEPQTNDEFVILGISLPESYITNAEARLDGDMHEYMLENNVYYYEYPLKFDAHFLATHVGILKQMHNNSVVRFQFGNEPTMALYIKQITIKFGENTLPQYDITLTDDIEIVLNKIGQVTEDVSRLRVQLSEIQKYYLGDYMSAMNGKLSRIVDDVALGRITFQQGLNSIGNVILNDEIKSNVFVSGMDGTGRGWKIDQLGNGELESLRVRSYLEVVELLINRLQAQEGDTLFTDNDQIESVLEKKVNGVTYYILTLKEKWDGYFTAQQEGNIIKGIVNTLAANYGNVSDIAESQCVESDGVNKYYTSWMRVVNPLLANVRVGKNQIVVILYDDADVPAQKNFPPCELMTIARYGCVDAPSGATETEKASVEKRQRLFSISVSDGRITKLTGVNKPILEEKNYGTTLGIIPDFINEWAIKERLIKGRDYLYAQGIIVGDFIKVDINGNPLINYVDVGEWVDGSTIESPSVGHGIYLCDEYNEGNLQWETHDVWHNGAMWRCLHHQPIEQGGSLVYYEPQENSLYWRKMLSSGAKGDDGEKGDDGATGKMGRNPYFSGEWVESLGGTFSVTDFETPYFFYNNNYWVWVGENGTFNINATNRPSSTNVDWEIMVTDFKYLISEAIFADFAKLGSAIFNGDYMFSQHGTHNNQASTQYQLFSPNDIYDNSGNAFKPHVLINWLTGYAHLGGDSVRFNPDGSGHLSNGNIYWDVNGNASFNGTINVALMYSRQKSITSSTYTIDPINDPANLFVCRPLTTDILITLPSVNSYEGLELRFMSDYSANYVTSITTADEDTTIQYSGESKVGWHDAKTIHLIPETLVILQNIDNIWYVIQGEVSNP